MVEGVKSGMDDGSGGGCREWDGCGVKALHASGMGEVMEMLVKWGRA